MYEYLFIYEDSTKPIEEIVSMLSSNGKWQLTSDTENPVPTSLPSVRIRSYLSFDDMKTELNALFPQDSFMLSPVLQDMP